MVIAEFRLTQENPKQAEQQEKGREFKMSEKKTKYMTTLLFGGQL